MGTNAGNEYKHRRGTTTLKLVGSDGTPLKNRNVVVRQTKHQFLFGCSEFSCIPFVNNEFVDEEKEKAEDRFQKFFDLFNYVTLPFYWGNFEPVQGQPDTKRVKQAAQWMDSKGLTIKGHPLCWHTVTAPWLMEMSNSEILSTQLDRINRDVTEFKGLIDIWDVINEVVIMPIFNKYDNGITRICKDIGRIKLVREVFTAAKKANPEAILLINDFNTSESYDILVEGLLEAGVPIDAVGIQSHMHQGYWGVEKTMEILERFSRFKLPIHFTENTLVSGHIMPPEIEDLNDYQIPEWPTTPEGEERQAREAALHYKTLFAHPMVESITWWDFVDGLWLGAPSGFLTRDNRVKPIYHEIHKLIKDEWWTKPLELVTDEDGTINVTGFFGEYEVVCEGKECKFNLDKASEPITISV
ncbi:MAG: endo-1,4-beta-xylanase [Clostridia bacterium]|nr:endo-1,4-beta-xylanase [Clostridia bacterium]